MAFLASSHALPPSYNHSKDNEMKSVIITKNVANQGGGIYVDRLLNNMPVLGPDVTIHSNLASEWGGGIAFDIYDVGVCMI